MNDNKKIAVNSLVIFAKLCIDVVIGIVASRIVIDALGASDYGLYNVVGGIVTMLNVLNTAMLSTSYRYIAFEIGKGGNGDTNKIFNTCFSIHLSIAAIILLVGLTVGTWYIRNYLNVEPGKLQDAYFVFFISIATAVLKIIMTPHQGLLVANEKFAINAIIDVVCRSIYFVVIIAFLYHAPNKIRLYSIIQLCYFGLSSIFYLTYNYIHYLNIIRIRINKEWKVYREMLSYSGWNLYSMFATSCQVQGSTLLINFFFGTAVNGAYAVAKQVEGYIKQFAYSLNNAAIPQITKNFSGGNSDRSLNITTYISKYTFILMVVVAFPVLLDMEFLLGLWLKEVPEGAITFCRLVVLGVLIDTIGQGITPMVQATGKIRDYILVIDSCLIVGILVCWLFLQKGASQYSVCIIYCIISMVTALLKIYMLRRLLKFDVTLFFKTSYLKIILISIPLIISYIIYDPTSFSTVGHILGILASEVFLFIDIAIFGLDERERKIINNYIVNKIK